MKIAKKMNEPAWLIGTVLCAFGVVLCTKADFGLSMMAAPPYIIHVALSKYLPWYTQGTSEYIFQALLLGILCVLVKKFRWKYLLSFLTAVFYGVVIDLWLWVFGGSAAFASFPGRVAGFICGELTISLSVAFVFRTYLPPQIAECLVVEVAKHYGRDVNRIKQINDMACLALSLILALTLTRGFTGIGVGTVVIVLVNAPLIRQWGKLLDRLFDFAPLFPALQRALEGSAEAETGPGA